MVATISRKSQVFSDLERYRPELVDFFKSNIGLVIGDGRRTQFWVDKWIGYVCLKEEFPRLFSLSMDKTESVNLVMSRRNEFEEGNLTFRRSLFQWDVEELRRLDKMLLNAPALREESSDRLRWDADASGFLCCHSIQLV